MTTGSIAVPLVAATPSPLAPLVRSEEWAAASPALVRALDPVHKGEPSGWADKAAGIALTFRAEGDAYVRNDQVCRAFVAEVTLQGVASAHLGTACRVGAGDWTVQKMKPWVKAG